MSVWRRFVDWMWPWCPSGMPHRIRSGLVKYPRGDEYCWHDDCVKAAFRKYPPLKKEPKP